MHTLAMGYSTLLGFVEAVKVLWVMAFGACIGSLTNVLVYRIPRGLDVVMPTSACPSCGTHLTWRENIPVIGWLALWGRCRFCRSAISAEYPIVEAFVAVLWGAVFLVLYSQWNELGIGGWDGPAMRPRWAGEGFGATWPMFILILVLFSSLVSMTLIDAKTFHIPMVLTWIPAVAGLVVHPLMALWRQYDGGSWAGQLRGAAPGWSWTIPTPGMHGWGWVGAGLAGMLGVGVSNLLLRAGVLTRSFADYDAWVKSQEATAPGEPGSDGASVEPHATPEMWIQYPHARREMLRELIFLGPILGLAMIGWWAGIRFAGPWVLDVGSGEMVSSRAVPLWLDALAGACLGYLIGGGVVWAMRVLGSLGFGKEALGLGDVHMMAAVGACLGWIDAALGFFGAAFVGVAWAAVGKIASGRLQRAMPFGPYLAIATVLVWFTKPWIADGIGRLLRATVRLP